MDDKAEAGCEIGKTLIDVSERGVRGAHLLDSSRREDPGDGRDVDGGLLDGMICPSGGGWYCAGEGRERTYWRRQWMMVVHVRAGMYRRDRLHPRRGSMALV